MIMRRTFSGHGAAHCTAGLLAIRILDVSVLGPLIAAPVKIKPRIGPAQGAQRNPVAMPSTNDCETLAPVVPVVSNRLPSATKGRDIQAATRFDIRRIPN